MRLIHAMPLAAAALLAACGSDADTDGDGAVSGAELAAEAEGLIQPRPGQYEVALELLEFDAPGIPEAAKEQMRTMFAGGFTEGRTFCMTPEDAAENGPEQMVKNLAESDCTMQKFNVSGGDIEAEMQCPSEQGGAGTIKMQGRMTAERSSMTMEMKQAMPNLPATTLKVKVDSRRVGECSA